MSRNHRCGEDYIENISDRISNTSSEYISESESSYSGYASECKSNYSDCEPSCEARVIRSQTEAGCSNVPVVPSTIAPGAFVGKIPIVLAETRVTIPIMSTIKLEKRAFEIKRIKKNVYVTQCHLIPPTHTTCGKPPTTGTLFLEGFVRKNIEYATKECESTGVVSGRIRHTTVEIPFRCTTTVTFLQKPVLRAPIFLPNIPSTEVGIYEDKLRGCDPCGELILGQDPCQQCFTSTEFFNEPVFCELISAHFNECDIHLNPKTCCESPTEQTFRKVTEKMLLTLTIKVLQKQQVGINAINTSYCGCHKRTTDYDRSDRCDRSDRSDKSDRCDRSEKSDRSDKCDSRDKDGKNHCK